MFGMNLKDLNDEFLKKINTTDSRVLSYKLLKYVQLSTAIPINGGFVCYAEREPLLIRFIAETVKIKQYEELWTKLIQPKKLKPVQ